MKVFNYRKALDMGYSQDEIDSYLKDKNIKVINKSNEPSIVPTPGKGAEVDYKALLGQKKPDLVSPVVDPSKAWVSEGFGYGHPAVDVASNDPNEAIAMTNPIGGVPFSGTVTDPSGRYYSGFGNYYGAIGASPQELAQMTPEERVRMSRTAQQIMAQDLSNEQANAQLADAFPGKNVSFSAHLQEPVAANPQGVATGSAKLRMGSTGNSTGRHAHIQTVDIEGQPVPYQQLLDIVRKKLYR